MGLSLYGKSAALGALLPNGTSRYVALFTTMPDSTGVGAVEATGSSYARKSYSAWLDETDGAIAYRKNNGAIQFTALTGSISGVVGWGIYDASSNGNLLAFGLLLSGGVATIKNFVNTDQPQFADQDLKVGIGEGS